LKNPPAIGGDQPHPEANDPHHSLSRECAVTATAENHRVAPIRSRRTAKEILDDLARALARQAAQEDYAAEQAREGTSPCASPSMPGSARTSRTPDR
jgi:hypothetical protein